MTLNANNKSNHTENDFQEVVNLNNVKASVEKVYIKGVNRTKNDVFTKHLKDVFQANNFEDMVRRAQMARLKMEKLGVFKSCKMLIDTSNKSSTGYTITYLVQEPRRFTASVNTLVGNNEGSLIFSSKLPNTFGRGEKLIADYTYGTQNKKGYGLKFVKPLQADPTLIYDASLFRYYGDQPESGYGEIHRGLSSDLTFFSKLGSHTLRWEGIWRHLSCLSNLTSFTVREQSGHSLKSSLKHLWSVDSRDDSIIPNRGSLFKVTQELAGLGGDTNFLKHEIEFQVAHSLPLNTVIQLTAAGGIMKSLNPENPLYINDKFFIGGPLTLRGFNIRGAGPHSEGNSLGADSYLISGLHFYSPLPFLPGLVSFREILRLHSFINAGNLFNLDPNSKPSDIVKNLSDTLRISYGLGLVLKLGGIARLELNYCLPHKYQKGDRINKGFQFGIGINFL